MPRHDREQLRLSMTAEEWAEYERRERAILESISLAPAAPASPETLAEVARVDVQAALDDDREPGETRQQTAARILAEGIEKRWTPPSGEMEPTSEALAYWAAVRARLEEIAGTQQAAPEKPAPTPHPAPAQDAWSLAWAATAMASLAADLWRESVGSRLVSVTRYTEAKKELDRALADEEERGRLRLEAARMWLAASLGPGADGGPQRILMPAALKALDNWASDETRRAP